MTKTRTRALAPLLLTLCCARLARAQPATPDLLNPCAFPHAEIREILGLDVERSRVADMKLPGGRDVGCLYLVKRSETIFTVRQIWDLTKSTGSAPEPGLRLIPDDPDHAAAGTGPPDHPSAELVYWRGKVRTRLLVHGPTLDPDAMLQKLQKLRRVP